MVAIGGPLRPRLRVVGGAAVVFVALTAVADGGNPAVGAGREMVTTVERRDPGPTADLADPGSSSLRSSATEAPSWSDDFAGPAGAGPDRRRWNFNTGGNGWGNRELQRYTSSRSNVRLNGKGQLEVVARKATSGSCWYGRCRYTSGRLLTLGTFSQQYGRFAARIKVPPGSGLWPAFWMLDTNVNAPSDPASAEIDVMEHVGSEPAAVFSSLHAARPSASRSSCVGYTLPSGRLADAFHVFAADWTPTTVTFSVDGHPTATRTRARFGPEWTFDQPMFLVLDLAVGGTWPGSPPASTRFPATMLVDYVRVRASARPALAEPVIKATRPGGCDKAR